ncbi:nuclear body protein SP140-like protein isoform X1 [Conger conger]|uniref:nuclear body protein SP140-like protein isoform X1 n=1 Tax=Conger conger TaxID=82655 RepID=UPI002A59B691|nr:nuclear body protein SP140-like protein isoform X1 [Conger conger]
MDRMAMDPLNFLTDDELLRFFHCKKTEMSCIEQPHTFLNQLRDNDLIPEDRYQKVIRMRSKQLRERGVYQILDWLETEKPHCIKLFWSCVFKDHILQLYPDMRLLKNNLLDGSFHFSEALPEKKEMSEESKEKEEKKKTEGKKCEKKRGKKMREREEEEDEEDEEPGPSTQSTPSKKKKPEKPCYGTPIRKGEKELIWEWPIFRTHLPVTCGNKKGSLCRDKLAKGEKCILAEGSWFAPQAFADFGGKKKAKKWKESIRCQNTPLQKLIQEGHLKAPKFSSQRRSSSPSEQRRTMSLRTRPSEDMISDSDTDSDTEEEEEEEEDEEEDEEEEEEEEEEENDEEEPERSGQAAVGNGDMSEFPGRRLSVTCGSATGTLQKDRFASGTSGKCIRTASRWLTPVEFAKEDQELSSSFWKKSILCQGVPLSDLIERKVLECHSLLCLCRICSKEVKDLEEQRNDDDCSVCGRRGVLLCCDRCPRAFHTECHLPAVEKRLLGEEWLCTYCVLTQFQGWSIALERSLRQALDCRTSDFMLQCHYLLLLLYCSDEDHIFSCDPSDTVPRYREFIQNPMWLKKVAEKLQEGQYSTVGQFESDILLIFKNAATFNRENEVGPVGARLKQLFETEFQQVFSVKNDSDASSGGPHNV